MQQVRLTGESIAANKDTAVSETIRSDRQRESLSEVAVSTSGDVNFELAFQSWDIWFEAALTNDSTFIQTITLDTGDIEATATNGFLAEKSSTLRTILRRTSR